MRPQHSASTLAGAALLILGLTGCTVGATGSTTGPGPAAVPSAKAADRDPKGLLTATAAVMAKAGSARLTLTGENPDETGTGWYGWQAQRFEVTTRQDGEDIPSRLVDGKAYLGLSAQDLIGDRHWLRIDLGSPEASGQDPDLADSVGSFLAARALLDPAAVLTATARAGRLTRVGEEQLDGVHTVHLQATADLTALTAALPGLGGDQQKLVADALRQEDDTTTLEFWINDRNELVQEKTPGAVYDGDVTVAFRELGSSTDLGAPPDGDVADPADAREAPVTDQS